MKNRGVIGFLGLFILVTVGATTVAKMTLQHYQDIRRASISKAKSRALILAISTEQYYAKLFEDEFKENSGRNSPAYDGYDENWALALPFLPVDDGKISAKITDIQAKLNINNLTVFNTWGNSEQVYSDGSSIINLGNLMLAMYTGVVKDFLVNPMPVIIDWHDTNLQQLNEGAEDVYYLGGSPSYRVANQWFSDISELNLLRGFDQHIVSQLKDWVTAIPLSDSRINVNTAHPKIIAWFLLQFSDGLSLFEQKIEVDRLNSLKPYTAVADFITEISNSVYYEDQGSYGKKREDAEKLLSVSSSHYLLETRVEILDFNIIIYSYLKRENQKTYAYRRELYVAPQYIPLQREENDEKKETSLFDLNNT